MKQGNKMGTLAKMLRTFGYEGADHQLGTKGMAPNQGRVKSRRWRKPGPTLYKSAVSGFPRSSQRCGSVPAPTMDQVRKIEREYGQRLRVFQGVMFFKEDSVLFTKEEGQKRYEADCHQENIGARYTN